MAKRKTKRTKWKKNRENKEGKYSWPGGTQNNACFGKKRMIERNIDGGKMKIIMVEGKLED